MWQKRHAIQIAAQLPDDPKDALLVLGLAMQIVEEFLMEPQDCEVLPFKTTSPRS